MVCAFGHVEGVHTLMFKTAFTAQSLPCSSSNMNNPLTLTKLIRTDPFYHEPMEGDIWFVRPAVNP